MSNLAAWAQDVAVRAVSTAAQAALGLVTANTAGWTHLSLAAVGSAAGLAALICVLQHLSDLKGILPAAPPVPIAVTTTSGTVATSPPVFTQTSDAPAAPISAPQVGTSATGANGTVFATAPIVSLPAPPVAG